MINKQSGRFFYALEDYEQLVSDESILVSFYQWPILSLSSIAPSLAMMHWHLHPHIKHTENITIKPPKLLPLVYHNRSNNWKTEHNKLSAENCVTNCLFSLSYKKPEAAISFQSNDPHKVSYEARGWLMCEGWGVERSKERSDEEYWIMVRWHTAEISHSHTDTPAC